MYCLQCPPGFKLAVVQLPPSIGMITTRSPAIAPQPGTICFLGRAALRSDPSPGLRAAGAGALHSTRTRPTLLRTHSRPARSIGRQNTACLGETLHVQDLNGNNSSDKSCIKRRLLAHNPAGGCFGLPRLVQHGPAAARYLTPTVPHVDPDACHTKCAVAGSWPSEARPQVADIAPGPRPPCQLRHSPVGPAMGSRFQQQDKGLGGHSSKRVLLRLTKGPPSHRWPTPPAHGRRSPIMLPTLNRLLSQAVDP